MISYEKIIISSLFGFYGESFDKLRICPSL